MKKITNIFSLLTLILLVTACENQDWSFPDNDITTVYFASQYPIRTIVLGTDETFDNTNDNLHKCIINATMGGVYSNDVNRTVDIAVTNSLCDDLKFKDGGDIVPMPSTYYTLSSNKLVIPKGKIMGGVEVQLTDAFFADPLSLTNTYVIPLVMSNVQNADSILSGKPNTENPNRCIATDWAVTPKDYILYAVKYINPWDAVYLRRGIDAITEGGSTSTVVRHKQSVINDEVYQINTLSLEKAGCTITANVAGETRTCALVLNFTGNECTVTTTTEGCTVTGSGKYVEKGEKNSFNNKDRDALYLDYKIDFGSTQIATKDTLVMRDRQVKAEYFTVVKK